MTSRSLSQFTTRFAPGLVCTVATSAAAQFAATVEIPQLEVSEYHRPYVAVWIEGPDRSVINVGVWYDVDMKNDEGESWLKDLRQWWRKSGRDLKLPIDGLSGPTRPVGTHEVRIPSSISDKLVDGEYAMFVEAAREVGGREVVRVPFTLSRNSKVNVSVKGERELGTVTLRQID
ncbi:MAG TPA: DUF2271 domain-containing protein [Opitutaceae bacterium]|nr:DUF2271 domain-containing protein [Opitutaceae bacterium]